MFIKPVKGSITIFNYIVSIIHNIQEKFSPQQWNITTFHISGYNIFLNISFYHNYEFIYLDKFISSIRCYYSSIHTAFVGNIFFFDLYFIKNSINIFNFKSFPMTKTIYFNIIFYGIINNIFYFS